MKSLFELSEIVKNAPNMVAIESVILTEVFNRHSCTYAKHVCRPAASESHNHWVKEVSANMGELMQYDRLFLFSLIPPRFFNTRIYAQLKQRIIS